MRRKTQRISKDTVFNLNQGNLRIPRQVFQGYVGGYDWTNDWVSSHESLNAKSPTQRSHVVNGWRPPLPYKRAVAIASSGHADFSYGGYRRIHGDTPMNSGSPFGFDPIGAVLTDDGTIRDNLTIFNLTARAETECLNKIRSDQIQLGEDIGQLGITLEEVASSVTRLLSAYRSARVGNWARVAMHLRVNKLRHLPKTFGDAWLAYIYGWKPLAQDIYSGVMQIADLVKKPLYVHARRRVESSYDILSPFDQWPLYSRSFSKADAVVQASVTVRLHGQVAEPSWRAMVANGLENPLTIAWNLLPYSFILDWILPVGNVLSAMTAPLGLDFKGGDRTLRVTSTFDLELTPSWTVPYQGTPFRINGKLLAINRSIYGTWPSPILYIKSPFSTTHVLNAIALIAANPRLVGF